MSKVRKISAVTLLIRDMERSCNFYSKIPGFKLIYGGSDTSFTTYEIGENAYAYINLELLKLNNEDEYWHSKNIFKIILHADDVDKLYLYFKDDKVICSLISFENEPINASWGERYFHIRDPDGYLLSFAHPIKSSD
ncbi:MAG TPA: VOC family protein [Nitrososphaeraceae archaeon]|nr:VOC family protein [Nitrososphaeraceae archaeon]